MTHTHTNNNLDSDRHSYIYMNIQYIYNTQLVQRDNSNGYINLYMLHGYVHELDWVS